MKRIYSIVVLLLVAAVFTQVAQASYHFSSYQGRPPIHVLGGGKKSPAGMTPSQIKSVYRLPPTGGHGTIVIVGAYKDESIENDLQLFSKQFNLPGCTEASGCLTEHAMSAKISSNSSWAMETSLDVEWAHAIAPAAKIVLVEATTQSGANLLAAVDYAATVKDAVSISMSWGGAEFPEEVSLDSHFKSVSGAQFFASSGDSGTGASWPASSPNVIGVGGTSVQLWSSSVLEHAWSGSGGGVSLYEKEPAYQTVYSIPKAGGMRAVPDVSYNADPVSGFAVVKNASWYTVGGTSAGAPQWAAIAALGGGVHSQNLYTDKASIQTGAYFRDITSGTNGSCGYFCAARAHYDYVTGLGSPLTDVF